MGGDLAVSLLVLVASSLLVPGLGTREALLAIVLGTVVGTVLLSLAGMVGSDTGVPTMVGLRPALVIHGSWAPGFVSYVGGTIPAFLFSFAAYWLGAQVWLGLGAPRSATPPAAAGADGS